MDLDPKGNCISVADLDWDNKELIGEGKFGCVYRTLWWTYDDEGNGEEYTVAVKRPSGGTLYGEIFAERNIKAELSHANILNILGFAQLDYNQTVVLVFEYTDGGSAWDYIWEMRHNGGATVESMMGIAFDIAKGMEYLHDNSYVHGDLALRNCVVHADNGTVKVGDLGFYEDRNDGCYFYDSKSSIPCPVRWMAPENLPYRYGRFRQMLRKPCTKSYVGDVWAFGVVLFEIWSRGEYPFNGCDDDKLVCKHVLDGQSAATWNSHFNMRYSINKLMKRCWEWNPENRPNFESIVMDFQNLMGDDESDGYDYWD